RVDPGGRDGERAPLPWTDTADHGWDGRVETWLPFPRNASTNNVERLALDERSILHLYRALLSARRAAEALRTGSFEWLPAPDAVLAHRRRASDERVAIVNFDRAPAHVDVAGDWVVEVSSTMTGHGDRWAGALAGDEAVLLRPAPMPG